MMWSRKSAMLGSLAIAMYLLGLTLRNSQLVTIAVVIFVFLTWAALFGGHADVASSGQKLKVVDTQSGKAPLAAAINFSFVAMDPGMVSVTPVIVAYAATLMSFKNLPGTVTATGASVMAVPPVLAPAFGVGAAGGSEDDVIKSALPEDMLRVFMHYKNDEWEKYLSAVTQWDVDTYLDVLP